eukprot:COSAG02_NODE_2289_length_9209_cov_3.304720_2_plen_85_part_00
MNRIHMNHVCPGCNQPGKSYCCIAFFRVEYTALNIVSLVLVEIQPVFRVSLVSASEKVEVGAARGRHGAMPTMALLLPGGTLGG